MKLFKRTLLGVALLAVLAYLAGAALVMFWDPEGPLGEVGPQDQGVAIWPGGYEDSSAAVTWEGKSDTPPADAYRRATALVRGPLDRHDAVFPLALRCSTQGIGAVGAVRLFVTSEGGWSDSEDDGHWTSLGSATLRVEGLATVATLQTEAPASACAYRVVITSPDGAHLDAFSKSMPTAPAFLGRVHDRIAWWPIYRWLPDMR